eukprot:TRINITY_DN12604_c0_g2_i1.p1 TRINITY_DN12604_c0_g2~~TRINITY_DN12604_c0_g2_i1.p1  ORF type:complete len:162 (-),score=42.97 TRINITY_DN12604_c0_g2_i1:25-480(-)
MNGGACFEVSGGVPVFKDGKGVFCREFFWFHHLYSKVKRRYILDWADELDLTGFSLPGKPGVVCVEGLKENVELFYARLKTLPWQKLGSKHRVEEECSMDGMSRLRKFEKLRELDVEYQGTKSSLGELRQQLVLKGLDYVFGEVFGIGTDN